MDYRWFNHLVTDDEKERFKRYIHNSKGVLDRQIEILNKWEEELTSKETTESTYDNPSWAALQADRNGYRRAIRRIKQLITLDPKDNNEPV